MSLGLALTFLTGLAWNAVGIIFSLAAKRELEFSVFMLVQSALSSLIACILIPDYGALIHGEQSRSMELAIVMTATALLAAAGFKAMRMAMESGRHGIVWTISQTSMIIPFAAAMILWKEEATAFTYLGLLLLAASLPLCSSRRGGAEGGKKGASAWLTYAFASFALIGMSQVASIVPSHWESWSDKGHLRVPMLLAFSTLLWLAVVVSQRRSFDLWRTLRVAAPYSFFVLIGQLLLYKSLDVMAGIGISFLVYPLAIGICISGFFIYSITFLKERLTWCGLAGVASAMTGIMILAAR